jgi:hypothetical protein
MMCETTRSVKKVDPTQTLPTLKLSLCLVLFGVCSASLEATAYPVSKNSFSSPFAAYARSQSSETIKLTRSARETSRSERVAARGPLAPGTHNLSLGVGQIFMLGDFSNRAYENAIGTQLTYTYGVSELFAFESTFGHSSHSPDLSLNFLSAGVRTNLIYFDQLVPFFNLGLGFYRSSETLTNGANLSALLFGLQLGTGLDLLISERIFFGTRLAFHDMFSSSKKDSNQVAHEVGGAFASFMIHVGVNF